ncbi:MAG: phage portal protein [Thiomicrospira sp.]|jgi:lambda family phage portal protein|nr:phage portal protein [Thiomicrospira sp.]
MRKLIVSPQYSNILDLSGKPLARGYEAASQSKRLQGFDASEVSPTEADASDLAIMRNRARGMVRNTAFASRAIGTDTDNEIGTGIMPRSKAPSADLRTALNELWDDWANQADADGILCAYGLQYNASRARKESGEVFIRIRPRRLSDGLIVPIQFQLIEADFCPADLTEKRPNGNEIKSGIEFNAVGRRVAYWFFRQHPADGGSRLDMVRVAADQIIHHFIPTRPGQIRGRPIGTSAFVKAHFYDKYDDAELVRKETRAHFTGVIRRAEYEEDDYLYDPFTGKPIDGDGVGDLSVQPGMFPSLLPGEDVNLFNSDTATDDTFAHRQLLAIAAAYDVPYEQMTGDFSKINDRVWRAIVNQYRRGVEVKQDLFVIQQVVRVMWAKFVDAAVLSGAVVISDFADNQRQYHRAAYQTHAWPYVHPLQDLQALKLAKEEGFESRQAIIARRGRTVEEVDQERKEDQDREIELGIRRADQPLQPFIETD